MSDWHAWFRTALCDMMVSMKGVNTVRDRIFIMFAFLLTDAFLLRKLRGVLFCLRFGICSKYAKRQAVKKKYAAMRFVDRLTLTPLVKTCKQREKARRAQVLYLIYTAYAIASDTATLFMMILAPAEKRTGWLLCILFCVKAAAAVLLTALYYRHGLSRTPTV